MEETFQYLDSFHFPHALFVHTKFNFKIHSRTQTQMYRTKLIIFIYFQL